MLIVVSETAGRKYYWIAAQAAGKQRNLNVLALSVTKKCLGLLMKAQNGPLQGSEDSEDAGEGGLIQRSPTS